MSQTWWKIFVNDLNSMVKIPLSVNFIDQQISFSSQCFLRVSYIFIMTLQFLNIFYSLSSILSSSSSSSYFPLFSLFLFFFLPFFFSFPSSFPHFFFSQFASFPQFGLPFPKSAAPVLPHFLLPWTLQLHASISTCWILLFQDAVTTIHYINSTCT